MRFTHQKPSLTHQKPAMTIISCPFLTANCSGTWPSKCHDCWSWKGENIKRWQPAAGKKVATWPMTRAVSIFLTLLYLISHGQPPTLVKLDRRASNQLCSIDEPPTDWYSIDRVVVPSMDMQIHWQRARTNSRWRSSIGTNENDCLQICDRRAPSINRWS